MSLTIKIHEIHEEEADFMSALRDTCAENFLSDGDDRLCELRSIREAAIANDDALFRMMEINPSRRDSYRQQWERAEADLEYRVMKLNLAGITQHTSQ